jgi:2-dehydropantoate 2-reductase
MDVLVMAAGAVGGWIGARLAWAGHRVCFAARGKHLEAMRAHGLRFLGPDPGEDFVVAAPGTESRAVADAEEAPLADLGILAVKWRDVEGAARALAGRLKPRGVALTVMNGVDSEEVLARAAGRARTAGATTSVLAVVESPGVVRRVAFGNLTVGEIAGPAQPRTYELCTALRAAGLPAEPTDDLMAAKWMKLSWNAAFNALNAITRRPVRFIADDAELGPLARRAMREVREVARAEGVDVTAFTDAWIEATVARTRAGMGEAPTSTLQDVLAGRPLEHDALSGAVVRRARSRGIAVPVNEALYAVLRALSPNDAPKAPPPRPLGFGD